MLQFVEPGAAAQQRLTIFCVAGVRRRPRRSRRVSSSARAPLTPRAARAISPAVPPWSRHEVRRDQVPVRVPACPTPLSRRGSMCSSSRSGGCSTLDGRPARLAQETHLQRQFAREQLPQQRRLAHGCRVAAACAPSRRLAHGALAGSPPCDARISADAGQADSLFQYASNPAELRAPRSRAASTSRSANADRLSAPKYSSPTLRPPTMVAWLSAVNDLLCMRRLTRAKSVTKSPSAGGDWRTG